jgi:hypothetical protein
MSKDMSDLDKFISRVETLKDKGAKEATFDVGFLNKICKEIKDVKETKAKTEEVLVTGGKFSDRV